MSGVRDEVGQGPTYGAKAQPCPQSCAHRRVTSVEFSLNSTDAEPLGANIDREQLILTTFVHFSLHLVQRGKKGTS